MNRDNFVNVVGYQLEKVHTGVIKWVLDDNNSLLTTAKRNCLIMSLLAKTGVKPNFSVGDITGATCYPEFSFGKALRLDLLVDISLKNTNHHYLAIEMKVDSIPNENQLKATFDALEKEFNCLHTKTYILVLLGSSQVTKLPADTHGFQVLRLEEVLDVFGPVGCLKDSIADQWLNSLREEEERWKNIEHHTIANLLASDMKWKELGYRWAFPTYYYIYDALRHQLARPPEWDIYSGSNNPVMNLKNSLKVHYKGHGLELYWEFNFQSLILKTHNGKGLPAGLLAHLRGDIKGIVTRLKLGGKEPRRRGGEYCSIWKWDFDFPAKGLPQVANETDKIIGAMTPHLAKL